MAKDFIQYSIDVSYVDNSYGQSVEKTKTFSTLNVSDSFEVLFKRIEQWRYDNGYILKTELTNTNCTPSQATDPNA